MFSHSENKLFDVKMVFIGKVVIITGASSGIGADTAIEFAKRGANVVLVGRNETRLNTIADKIKNSGAPTPLAVVADVSRDAKKIIEQTIYNFCRLDILVNNAAYGLFDTASNIDLDKFDKIFATNIRAVVELTKLSISHLERTKGNIVNVSSIAGVKPIQMLTSLSMTKAALDMYTKCASLELAPMGIRVNSVNPGFVRTSFFQPMGIDVASANDIYEKEKSKYPVGRIGEVADITNAILFLASEKSSFINGAILLVDGGITNGWNSFSWILSLYYVVLLRLIVRKHRSNKYLLNLFI